MPSTNSFTLTRREDGIALLTMDVPGESMNTLKAEFVPQMTELLAEIRNDSSIKGLVVISGKKDSFVAGADISMLAACETSDQASDLSRAGHKVFAELENLPMPVVAAINGACLGGGLELALACHKRVCSDDAKTQLGLPEVQLGLLPGSGGTQRLPRLIGIGKALDIMLTGKQLRPKQALKLGLVDDVVPNTILLDAAIKLVQSGKQGKARKNTALEIALETTHFGRNVLFDQARKQVLGKTKGNYPAPLRIIEAVRIGADEGMAAGLATEARYFGELVMTPESAALRSIFFATTEMKKETGAADAKPRAINKAVVLGGGLMGGGIASVTVSKAKIPVRVKDISQQGLSNALSYAYKLLSQGVKRRYLSAAARDKQMSLMSTTVDYVGVKDADIVVEAVFEDLNLKHQMVQDIERKCSEHTVFASNTSSLPISQIASVAARPENVIGLHYFSPVEKMPLVEVIAHDKTSPETIATTVAFARKQGKTPIVVKDGAGFYVNRILALYMNEAAQLLLEGNTVEKLDSALVKFGFPVGPITLLDEVGIDVGAKIGPILEAELGARFKAPSAFDRLLGDNRKGRKNGRGFYQYGKPNLLERVKQLNPKTPKKQVDTSVYKVLGINPSTGAEPHKLAERCVVQMLNEAVRCLEEGIISSPRDGDIGAIFGIGFPPFLGGPFHYIDSLGAANLVALLKGYQQHYGERFAPAAMLESMAANNERFFN